MEEIWKKIEGFEDYYEVSNLGRVRRIGDYCNQNASWELKEYKILKPRIHNNGYLRVMFSVNGKHYDKYIHRLVAKAFCKNMNIKKYKEVNHKDGNKKNNIYTNLEWCDRSFNNKHAYVNGLHTVHGCYGKKKMVAKIDIKSNKVLTIYDSIEAASQDVGLKNYSNISACCNYVENPQRYKRPCLTAKGYKWRFIKDDKVKVGDIIND